MADKQTAARATFGDRQWLSAPEAAEYLGVAVSTLYRWRKQGRIRFYRLGERVSRIKREDLDALAQPQLSDEQLGTRQEWHRQAETLFQTLYEEHGIGDDSAQVLREARQRRAAQLGGR